MESTKNNKKCSRVQVLTKGDRIVCRSTRNITRDDSDSPQSAHCPAFSGNLDLSLICCVRVTTSLSLLLKSLAEKDILETQKHNRFNNALRWKYWYLHVLEVVISVKTKLKQLNHFQDLPSEAKWYPRLQFGEGDYEVCWGESDSRQERKVWAEDEGVVPVVLEGLCQHQGRSGPGQERLGPGSPGRQAAAAAAGEQGGGGAQQLARPEVLPAWSLQDRRRLQVRILDVL